jgi:hypothetical protein
MSYHLRKLRFKPRDVKGGKATRMKSNGGHPVRNQWLIETDRGVFFQSYNAIIAYRLKEKTAFNSTGQVWLDRGLWNCSRTTARYRRLFLGEGIEETRNKIKSGEYKFYYLNTFNVLDEDYIEKLT